MSTENEKIKELATKYQLTKDDFWQLPQNKRLHILTHDACEKIASVEGVRYQKPEWLSKGQDGVWAVEVSGFKKDDPENVIWTTGEASRQNCTAKYFVNMAEKRGKDRLILKLIRAYEYGIKSEEEADDFKKPSVANGESKSKSATKKKVEADTNGSQPKPKSNKKKGDILEALREAVIMLDDKQAVFNTADKLFSEGQKSFDANKLKALSADKLELVLGNIKKQIEEINK
tara:strand:+ start:2428 stop:3120 length:693 start_codon:yes stop_codon:yes gene_type:complete